MPMLDWLHKYPHVQALLQQDADVLEGVSVEDVVVPDAWETPAALPVVPATGARWSHGLLRPVALDPGASPPCVVAPAQCDTPHGAPVCTCGAFRLRWEAHYLARCPTIPYAVLAAMLDDAQPTLPLYQHSGASLQAYVPQALSAVTVGRLVEELARGSPTTRIDVITVVDVPREAVYPPTLLDPAAEVR